ncbi:Fc.00g113320.m01.CDS01 [Cosmosporella sp. VM-42]
MGREDDTLSNAPVGAGPCPDEPPPSYSESTSQPPPRFPALSSSSSQPPPAAGPSTQPAQPSQPQSQIPRQFPSAFNVYRVGALTRQYVIGEHQTQPIYLVSLHGGLSESAPITLHSGPSETMPPIATVEWQVFGPSFEVALPPPSGSNARVAQEKIQWASRSHGFGNGVYRFSIEVGSTNVRETFEWRFSRGDAISSLGGSYGGWKLVRMARGPPGGGGAGDMNFVTGGFTDSEGNEVVAAWTNVTGSLTKAAKFQFMGTGDTGLLGQRWAIITVITAFALFYRDQRRRRNR